MTYTPIPQRSWQATLTTGFSQTIPDGITIAIINASGLLASGTITLPLNPTDGQPITLECPKGLTLLTLAANTGQTISNSYTPVAIGVNTPLRLKYAQINSTWYPN